jgi:hypothetical protein
MTLSVREFNKLIEAEGPVPCESAPDVFYPADDDIYTMQDARYAKSLCAACPIVAECLAFAIDQRENYGVWGGTLPHERGMGARVVRRL